MKTRAVFCLASLNFPGREKTYSCFVAWGCKLTYSGPLGYYFHRFPSIPLSNIFQKAKLWIRKEKNWSEHVAILEMLSSLSSQVSGKLGKHGSMVNSHVAVVFLFEPEDDRCLWAAFVVTRLLLTKQSMKRQNGILSAMLGRVEGDRVWVRGWERGRNRIITWTQSQEALVTEVTFPRARMYHYNNHSVNQDKRQSKEVVSKGTFGLKYFTYESTSLEALSDCCCLQRTLALLSQS